MTWFDRFLADSARYAALAKSWYESKGKPYPGDPARPLIDAVSANGGEPDKHIGSLVESVTRDG